MNKARYIRLIIFSLSIVLLLLYPLYVRNYILQFINNNNSPENIEKCISVNTEINKILIFNSLLIIIFPLSVLYIFLIGRYSVSEKLLFKRNQVDSNSKSNFQLDTWYNLTRRFLGNEWFVNMYRAIEKEKLVPNNKLITLVSPAANKGVYEKYLYDHLKKQNKVEKFIIADIDQIDNNIEIDKDDKLNFIYGREALKIDDYITKVGIEKVDLIFDIKGSLWYSFRSDGDKEILLKKFHSVLNNDGIIIIDNSKKRFLPFLIYYLFGKVSWYVETSTGFLINRAMNRSKEFRSFIQSHFSQKEVSFVNEYGDLFEIIVLRKRNENN